MGRLFWKFFTFFWLAALLLALSVGSVLYFKHGISHQSLKDEIVHHYTEASLDLAGHLYQYEGEASLLDYLQQRKQTPFPTLLTLNEHDQDILGRNIPQAFVQKTRELAELRQHDGLITVTNDAGRNLLIFSPVAVIAASDNPDELTDLFLNANWSENKIISEAISSSIDLVPLALASLVVAIIFSASLAWYFTQPIRILKKAFYSVSQGQLHTRIGHLIGNRRDEFSELGNHFDEMTATIEHLIAVQQSLLHDVSHELRSPLARLQAAIGLAEQQPSELQNTLARIDKETGRIDNLVGQLLVLSRMNSGLAINQVESLSLLDVATVIIEDAQFEAVQHNISIQASIPEELTYTADAELIHRAIENIVRNAIKFSPNGGVVSIEVVANDVEIVIRIQDEGPGVQEESLSLLFTPFYKAATPNNNDGVGLGMAITKRAIEAHGGRIIAYNRQPTGFCVEMILPRQSIIDKNKLQI